MQYQQTIFLKLKPLSRLKILSYLALMLIFGNACSTDDENKEVDLTVQNLTGKWKAVELRDDNDSGASNFRSIPEEERMIYHFGNESYFKFEGDQNCEGTYNLNSGERELYLSIECPNNPSAYFELQISFLSKNQMILKTPHWDQENSRKFIRL